MNPDYRISTPKWDDHERRMRRYDRNIELVHVAALLAFGAFVCGALWFAYQVLPAVLGVWRRLFV